MELLLFQDILNKIDSTSNKRMCCILKNEIKPSRQKGWFIPPAQFKAGISNV